MIDYIKEYIKSRIKFNREIISDIPTGFKQSEHDSYRISIHNANIIELRSILKFVEKKQLDSNEITNKPAIDIFLDKLIAVNEAAIKICKDKEDA